MTTVEGEFVVSEGYIMDMMYIASENALCVAGCQLVGPDNEEYILDRKGFQALQIKTGLKVKIEGKSTYCTYADGETEVFEITSKYNWYDDFEDILDGYHYSDMWIDTFLRKKGIYVLNEEEACRLVERAVKGRQS